MGVSIWGQGGSYLHMDTKEHEIMDQRDELEDEGLESGWCELRLQGKLPERRSNHCSFITMCGGAEYLYIHGGRDLKEGAHASMWRLNLTEVQHLQQDCMHPVEWECVKFQGKGPGKISHHTASPCGDQVLLYGGLCGEDSLDTIYCFALENSMWTKVIRPEGIIGRDDHALCTAEDGSLLCFGGFVNGSRSSEICCFDTTGNCTFNEKENDIPNRAGHTTVLWQNKMFVFGGTDDDNDKLGDLWCYDRADNSCREIATPEGDVCPVPRSGHTAVVAGNQMFVFGGILELTKELNDLSVFDFTTEKWVKAIEDPFAEEKEKQRVKEFEAAQLAEAQKGGSPFKRMGTMVRPAEMTGTQQPSSPNRRTTTLKLGGSLMQLQHGSPPKKKKLNEKKSIIEGEAKKDGLTSPTSISMQQSFLIKNADQSFDTYYQAMRRRTKTGLQFGGSNTGSPTKGHTNAFGSVPADPTARDGHSANLDSAGNLYIFGGDRHQMPFNDLYMINTEKLEL